MLDELLPSEHATFVAACEVVELSFGERLIEPGALVEHVYFPLDSFISLIVGHEGDKWLEVAMAGREGMVGESLLLGVEEFPLCALVQGSGLALRMDAACFRRMMLRFPALQQRLQRYLYVVMVQLAQTAACTHFHQVEARLARWLLMTQDRASSSTLQLTHEFLAGMLGVRRAGVTSAALALQHRDLISYHRGNIIVLDREGLINASCGCYRADRALYDQVL
ncbi:Crp/Fnr family transcriptional regulator [Halomonas salipaludis]|uniref:Crp/Fnr family transcriptional regulator n=2 Tax=Halomonas salipaludis TaxID=2032625 RepID=A0A2A2F0B0_9GAMM|nr:Crp/Fnr family transcriptional regulator [Halomonas salipaludis]